MGKEDLRKKALEARRALKPAEIARVSTSVEQNLLSLAEFRRAQTVASYVAKEDEVQTEGIIERAIADGKRVLAPRAEPSTNHMKFYQVTAMDELESGDFGVLEPKEGLPEVPLSESQVIIVPIVAWDGRGYRLGYGKGHFDTELPHRGRSVAIGLAMEPQRIDRVPESDTDVPLDMIVTEKRIMRFSKAGGSQSR
jgi:5-formyltetrahydrofolate cyclo-ligase